MDPWTRPIFDSLRETYSAAEIEKMMSDGIIEIVPLGFMRGRTFKNAWIIADEMQNSSPMQMFMLATRIGEGSKMIITGDLHQSDLNANTNGLLEINNKLRHSERHTKLNYIRYIEFDKQDVQRSRAAKSMLDIWGADSRAIPLNIYPPELNVSEEFNLSNIYTDYNEETRYSNEFAGEVASDIPLTEEKDEEPRDEKDYYLVSPNVSSDSPAAKYYIGQFLKTEVISEAESVGLPRKQQGEVQGFSAQAVSLRETQEFRRENARTPKRSHASSRESVGGRGLTAQTVENSSSQVIEPASSDAALMPLEHIQQIRQYRTYYNSSGIEEL